MNKLDIENLTIEQYFRLTWDQKYLDTPKISPEGIMNKKVEDMTIAEYVEYEKLIQNTPKPEFQQIHNPEPDIYPSPTPVEDEVEDIDAWIDAEVDERMNTKGMDKGEAIFDVIKSLVEEYKAKRKQLNRSVSSETSEIQGVTFLTDDENDEPEPTLPCQSPPKELAPGNFILPCTIGNLSLYAKANLGTNVNIIPKSLYEHLNLNTAEDINLKEEIEINNTTIKIDKFSFLADFQIRDLPDETILLRTPFL
ncbi:hypothetical protein Tco_0182147, partial [Tanacetum coccineum]